MYNYIQFCAYIYVYLNTEFCIAMKMNESQVTLGWVHKCIENNET